MLITGKGASQRGELGRVGASLPKNEKAHVKGVQDTARWALLKPQPRQNVPRESVGTAPAEGQEPRRFPPNGRLLFYFTLECAGAAVFWKFYRTK